MPFLNQACRRKLRYVFCSNNCIYIGMPLVNYERLRKVRRMMALSLLPIGILQTLASDQGT